MYNFKMLIICFKVKTDTIHTFKFDNIGQFNRILKMTQWRDSLDEYIASSSILNNAIYCFSKERFLKLILLTQIDGLKRYYTNK